MIRYLLDTNIISEVRSRDHMVVCLPGSRGCVAAFDQIRSDGAKGRLELVVGVKRIFVLSAVSRSREGGRKIGA